MFDLCVIEGDATQMMIDGRLLCIGDVQLGNALRYPLATCPPNLAFGSTCKAGLFLRNGWL